MREGVVGMIGVGRNWWGHGAIWKALMVVVVVVWDRKRIWKVVFWEQVEMERNRGPHDVNRS